MPGKGNKSFVLILLWLISPPLSGATQEVSAPEARWMRAQAMLASLNVPPESPLARNFKNDFARESKKAQQPSRDSQQPENYLSRLRDLKRLEGHAAVLHWILAKPEAPHEVRAMAEHGLFESKHWKKNLTDLKDVHADLEQALARWDKYQMPPLRKAYPAFFAAGEEALEVKLQNALGPSLKKRGTLNLRYIEERHWGFRPLGMIRSLVIHHTQLADIGEIYHKHTSEGRFEEDLAPFIAYHFLIDPEGRVFWLNGLTERVWHARGANATSIGIALLGDLEAGRMSGPQFAALEKLSRTLAAEFRLDPQTAIQGHGDLLAEGNDTRCPGAFGREAMNQLKFRLTGPH